MSKSPEYPGALLKWSGNRDGAVRTPFRKGTGRPAGKRIMTPLLARLRDWSTKLVNGGDVPTTILLVGGPGNGKTDAVDGLVEDLDVSLGLDGKLYEAFGEAYSGQQAEKSPRRIDIDLDSLLASPASHLKRTLSIVQDATEDDQSHAPGKTSQQILLDELESVADDVGRDIYICCVNRGILAEAYTEAHRRVPQGSALNILREITAAVTSSPDAKACWPLDGFPSIVAWPMDVDSLVEADDPESGTSVLHQILEKALDESKWPKECPAGDWCPFCTNRRMLSSEKALDHLAELLRAFELGTGKRWAFRDIYSLVPYMLVGDEDDFVIDGKRLDPCEWAARQVQYLESTKKADERFRARALNTLVSHLYWHRLFPLWPKLAGEPYRSARKKIIKPLNSDLMHADDLFRFLAWPGRQGKTNSISAIISETLCPLLDPANAAPEEAISTATTRDFSVREVDEYFSLSVEQGLRKVKKRISRLEVMLLQRLAAADESLCTDSISSQDKSMAETLQRTLRLFACRLAKRSLGTRAGVFCNRKSITEYSESLRDRGALRKVQQELKKLVNDPDKNLFIASLMTTFAQPPPPKRRSVNLETGLVKVSSWKTQETERPSPQLSYLKVNADPVPLTFELFDALRRLDRGLHAGSLSDEVFAMVDRLRARVTGAVVRDEDRLLEDAVIVVEPTREHIRYVGDGFVVEKSEITR